MALAKAADWPGVGSATAVLGFNTRIGDVFGGGLPGAGRAGGRDRHGGRFLCVGLQGLVTDGMAAVSGYTYLYTCGPGAQCSEAVDAERRSSSGQFSFEERMGCGFGACMGCSCETKYGHKRICRDGPVLEREEIVW